MTTFRSSRMRFERITSLAAAPHSVPFRMQLVKRSVCFEGGERVSCVEQILQSCAGGRTAVTGG